MERVICAFQPHTYTRTKALFNDFVKELRVPDVVVLAEIYAAREQNDIGISSMEPDPRDPRFCLLPHARQGDRRARAHRLPGRPYFDRRRGDIFKAGEKLLKEEK